MTDQAANPVAANRAAIEAAIREAFAGVVLGDGVSLRQAALLDASDEEASAGELASVRGSEVVDDWAAIPAAELARDNIAQLDAAGLRYYLPALALWLLDRYDDAALRLADEGVGMTVIGVIGALAPSELFADELYEIYDGFTSSQRAALAGYVAALPSLVALGETDAERIDIAIDEYWSQFF
jgi:hypothetical protein